MKTHLTAYLILLSSVLSITSWAQKRVTLKVEPDPTVVQVNTTLKLKITALDEAGNELEEGELGFFPVALQGTDEGMIFTKGITVDSVGTITAAQTGEFDLFIFRSPNDGEHFANVRRKVQVVNQEVGKINVKETQTSLYTGGIVELDIEVLDKSGYPMDDIELKTTSSNPNVLEVDAMGNLYALQPGKAAITFQVGSLSNNINFEVVENPVDRIDLSVNATTARTGDVLQFASQFYNKKGKEISDVPVQYYVRGKNAEPGSGAGGQIGNDGRFVAEKTGTFIITATSGDISASKAVSIVERNISRTVEMIGHGAVSDKHTSDLWVWEGQDGKDYAVTGTWGSDGKAYFWDVTDPANIIKVDSVQVDARTVNDVKVSEDGTICVISREGASNRKNGIIIIDVTNPREVEILSEYTERLTGGVHNLFIYKNHVYALSNSQRYEIINIDDPKNPKRVADFELSNSNRSIHDVWIVDGIAYSSNWADGIVMVDIGNGVAGGSPDNPVEISRAHVFGDANHAAFPFKSKDTGKFYVVAGDEIFPISAMNDPGATQIFTPSGYLHFMDMTDPDNPKEVARYEVPEAGSHNFWIEGDLLYIGYYNAGLRVVDISGDLMGNLYNQGREIARFKGYDADGYVPNTPFVWGAQPYKGHIFFSDFNSGLWSAKMEPIVPDDTKIDIK